MSKQYTTLSRESIKYLCSIIQQVVSLPTDVIDNINLATNTTYSSIKIKTIVDQTLENAKEYANEVCAALVKLECRKTTTQPTLDNSDINVIYLYSADGNAPFHQYLKISETELIDMGSTAINLDGYLSLTTAASTYVKQSDYNTLAGEVSDIKDEIGTETLTTTSNTIKGAINEVANKSSGILDLTEAQYNELYNNGSIVIDGETITYDPETYYVINDDSTMLNVTDTINSSSTTSQIPNAKAVFDECKQGRLIDQSVINTYGTEMLKYPLGRWYINLNTIAAQFTDRPCDEAGILEIASIHPNGDPWAHAYMYRMYKYTAIRGEGTYLRDIDSGSIAGSIQTDTGWKKVCTTKVTDVPWTSITPTSILKRGTIVYRVKHGICYVVMDNICSSSMSTNNQIIATGLPKPEDGISGAWYQLGSNVDSTAGPIQNLLIRLTNEGNIKNYYGTNEVSYYGSFSYPVKES